MLYVLIETGPRRSEVVNLQWVRPLATRFDSLLQFFLGVVTHIVSVTTGSALVTRASAFAVLWRARKP